MQIVFPFKRPWDYNFTHFRYRNFGIVPDWFIIKFHAIKDYWTHPCSFWKSICCFLAIQKRLIIKYRIFFEKEKFNIVNVIIGWLKSYFMWLIPIYQVNFSWKDLVHLLLKNASFGGWVIFQAFSIYLVYLCQNLNFIANFKFLAQMMKNEGSNSLTDIKSSHLKIALLFSNIGIIFNYIIFLPQWTL